MNPNFTSFSSSFSVAFFLLLSLVGATSTGHLRHLQSSQDLFNSNEIDLAPGIVAVIAMGAGAVFCFYGYAVRRFVIFAAGFTMGAFAAYSIFQKLGNDNDWPSTAEWIAFIVGGFLGGVLAVGLYSVGIFAIGAVAGVLLAMFLNTAFLHSIAPENPNTVLYVTAIILGLAGGFLVIHIERPAIIIATSFFGGDALVWGIGYFAGNYPDGTDLESLIRDGNVDLPDAFWAYFALTLLAFAMGLYTQFKHTAPPAN